MYQFGRSSRERLETCKADLRLILTEALKVSPIDFGISEGVRSFQAQLDYFLHGKSRLDPRDQEQAKKCKHLPDLDGLSNAADVYAYVPGRNDLAFDFNHLCVIAGVIIATANRLKSEGKVSTSIRWGGNWDGDGQVITDQTFNDLPHFELIP